MRYRKIIFALLFISLITITVFAEGAEQAVLYEGMPNAVSQPVFGYYKIIWGWCDRTAKQDMLIVADYLQGNTYVNDYSSASYLCPGCAKEETETQYLSNETYWRVWLEPRTGLAGDSSGWGMIKYK